MGCTVSTKDLCKVQGGLDSNRLHPPNWDKEADHLHDAVRGQGSDGVCIVRILAKFTNRQRKRLLQAYTERFHEDLTTVMESEFSGTAKEVVTVLLYSPVTYDVKSLHKAFEDQNFNSIVSIIISSRNDSLMDMKDEYFAEYGKTLENELSKVEDEDVRRILVSLLNVDRSSAKKRADKMAAKERATQLFNDGDILSLLCQPLGRNQLRETFAAFLDLHRVNIAQFIEDRCSSLSQQARDTLKDCVLVIETPPRYFAKEMAKADELKILRIMVSRSEIDLYYIKKEFLSLFSRQLHDAIDKQCSYDYAKLLKAILEMRGQYSESAKKR
ncbi:annexin A13-like isoform X1 [Orbicella faveolata]|uniref:annexin A13-like isoform X1 n=1 Tax=Orbicella faveolata TaxID=48498 RepID=UPI0009E48ED6|nr:annexin A13-like isoform X1 [Orbicella faveolata]